MRLFSKIFSFGKGARKFFVFVFLSLTVILFVVLFRTHKAKDFNVIVISIDALRADHLGCYGYPRDVSPQIDAFARKSIRASVMTTPCPYTTPAMVSMLTGQYPQRHGIRTFLEPAKKEITFLQEILLEKGYQTAAFIGNWVLRKEASGLDQGFLVYDDNLPTAELNRKGVYERSAPALHEAVMNWLSGNYHKKFFMWIHYQDVHGPYTAPKEYALFKHDTKDMVPVFLIPQYQKLPWIEVEGLLTDANAYRDAYDAEIRYCDTYIGKLLKEVDSLGLLKNTIIIVTADHGESMGEHNYYFNHGHNLHFPSLRIPLLAYIPGMKSKTVESPVNLVDIVPTLLNILDYDPVPTDGKSVWPILKGEEADERDEPLFMEKGNQQKAVRTKDWKLIVKLEDNHYELYNLENDPQETVNVFAQYRTKTVELKSILDQWMNTTDYEEIEKLEDKKLQQEEIQALRSLGYLQ